MRKSALALLAFICLSSAAVYAQEYQNTPVTVSSEKINKGGSIYYAHTVLEHQTLYSISKAYNLSYDEIVAANPGQELMEKGVRTGQILLLPDRGQVTAAAAQTAAPSQENASVQPVPQAAPQTAADASGYTEYQVKWYEDLDAVASKFNVSKEVLIAFNGLKDGKVARKKIKIPHHPERVLTGDAPSTPAGDVDTAQVESVGDESVQENPEADILSKIRGLFKGGRDVLEVGVILPFNAKGKANDSAYDLYSGILMAVKDLSAKGLQANLKVYDIKNTQNVFSQDDLADCDMVIGPISPVDLEAVIPACPEHAAVISPLDPKAVSLTESYHNFIQAPSSSDAQNQEILRWVKESYRSGDKIMVISEKGVAPTPLMSLINASDLNFIPITYGILEGRNVVNTMEKNMTPTGMNHVIITSENEAFVNDAVRNLSVLTYKELGIRTYASSKIRSFETIEVENLHRINAHIACSYFVDYDKPETKRFLLGYRALFGAEPTPFAYQGYDTAYYFISSLLSTSNEDKRLERMCSETWNGLQSDFRLSGGRSDVEGYANTAVRRVVYGANYSIAVE